MDGWAQWGRCRQPDIQQIGLSKPCGRISGKMAFGAILCGYPEPFLAKRSFFPAGYPTNRPSMEATEKGVCFFAPRDCDRLNVPVLFSLAFKKSILSRLFFEKRVQQEFYLACSRSRVAILFKCATKKVTAV